MLDDSTKKGGRRFQRGAVEGFGIELLGRWSISLLPGSPEQLCSGVFLVENAHERCGIGQHP